MNDKFMPKSKIEGHIGYYPVCNAKEWDNLPEVYKSMEWYPHEVTTLGCNGFYKEKTIPEYVIFDVVYMTPYKIRAEVKVHVQEVQKILYCSFDSYDCHLYSIKSVVFQNGEVRGAKWLQDSITGAFAVYSCGRILGRQGGFREYVPEDIEETENGWKWKGFVSSNNRIHHEIGNPFK